MDKPVSIIIPAYNEEERIGLTLSALHGSGSWFHELIVVDDGSVDETFTEALKWTSSVFRLSRNEGKAAALIYGVQQSAGHILLFLDADLADSAGDARWLTAPIQRNEADMTVAVFPKPKKSGFGLVKNFAARQIFAKTGVRVQAPLSGQRAIKREVFQACYRGDTGFGFEVGLTLDCLLADYRVKEVGIHFKHRETGQTVQGYMHRMKQGWAVLQALQRRT